MLKISRTVSQTDGQTVMLKVEGQVRGEWVEELRRVFDAAVNQNGHHDRALVFDLADVSFIDARGLDFFRAILNQRVRVVNCSLFVAEQLKGVTDVDA